MLEKDSTEVVRVWKTVLIALAALVVFAIARRVFPEFFQCQSSECLRTHLGEP